MLQTAACLRVCPNLHFAEIVRRYVLHSDVAVFRRCRQPVVPATQMRPMRRCVQSKNHLSSQIKQHVETLRVFELHVERLNALLPNLKYPSQGQRSLDFTSHVTHLRAFGVTIFFHVKLVLFLLVGYVGVGAEITEKKNVFLSSVGCVLTCGERSPFW